MSSSEIASTSFRFVVLRNLQALKPAILLVKFVQQDAAIGSFHIAASTRANDLTKSQAVTTATASTSAPFLRDKRIRTLCPQIV